LRFLKEVKIKPSIAYRKAKKYRPMPGPERPQSTPEAFEAAVAASTTDAAPSKEKLLQENLEHLKKVREWKNEEWQFNLSLPYVELIEKAIVRAAKSAEQAMQALIAAQKVPSKPIQQ
jgi:hypothetical protein